MFFAVRWDERWLGGKGMGGFWCGVEWAMLVNAGCVEVGGAERDGETMAEVGGVDVGVLTIMADEVVVA